MISIITINYNNIVGLKKTIDSVLNQSYNDIEYIIIDGGSQDGSYVLIKNVSNKIKYWISENDNGVYEAMNKGLYKASGDYCLFLNSGDYLYERNTIEKVAPFLDSKYDIVYGDVINKYTTKEIKKVFPTYIGVYELLTNSAYPHQSTFIKTSILNKLEGYDESFMVISDWLFFLRAIIEYNVTIKKVSQVISIFDMYGVSNTTNWKYEIDTALNKYYPYLIRERKNYQELHYYRLSRIHKCIKIIIDKLKHN